MTVKDARGVLSSVVTTAFIVAFLLPGPIADASRKSRGRTRQHEMVNSSPKSPRTPRAHPNSLHASSPSARHQNRLRRIESAASKRVGTDDVNPSRALERHSTILKMVNDESVWNSVKDAVGREKDEIKKRKLASLLTSALELRGLSLGIYFERLTVAGIDMLELRDVENPRLLRFLKGVRNKHGGHPPRIFYDPTRLGWAWAEYSPNSNRIYLSRQVIERLAQGEWLALSHELRHAGTRERAHRDPLDVGIGANFSLNIRNVSESYKQPGYWLDEVNAFARQARETLQLSRGGKSEGMLSPLSTYNEAAKAARGFSAHFDSVAANLRARARQVSRVSPPQYVNEAQTRHDYWDADNRVVISTLLDASTNRFLVVWIPSEAEEPSVEGMVDIPVMSVRFKLSADAIKSAKESRNHESLVGLLRRSIDRSKSSVDRLIERQLREIPESPRDAISEDQKRF